MQFVLWLPLVASSPASKSRWSRCTRLRARIPPCYRPCVAGGPAGHLGTIRGARGSARPTARVVYRNGERRFQCITLHSIATGMCRKTNWLLCGKAYTKCWSHVAALVFPVVVCVARFESTSRILATLEKFLLGRYLYSKRKIITNLTPTQCFRSCVRDKYSRCTMMHKEV